MSRPGRLAWRRDPPTAAEVKAAIKKHRTAVWWWCCMRTSPEPQPIQFTIGLQSVLFRDPRRGSWQLITDVPKADCDRWAPCIPPPPPPAEEEGEDN